MTNRFNGEGNLGADPEVRQVVRSKDNPDETRAVANLRVFFDRQKRTDDGYEDAGGFWLNVEIWGTRAEHVERLLGKGDRVEVSGEIVDDSYEKDGATVTAFKCVARSVNLVLTSKIESLTHKAAAAA
ncbi:MAG: single-stranded DNA-binding protein [Pseudomonadota bacterium]